MFRPKGRTTKRSYQDVDPLTPIRENPSPATRRAFQPPSRPVRSPNKGPLQLFSPVKDVRARVVKQFNLPDLPQPRSLSNRHGRFVVSKELPSKTTTTNARLRGVRRFLDHDNLVRLLDWEGFESESPDTAKVCHYEFCDGGNLREKIDKFPDGLPEGFIWHILKGVLKGLIYLHAGKRDWQDVEADGEEGWRPCVHNLISPDNIHFQRTTYVRAAGKLKLPVQWQAEEVEGRYPTVKLGNFSRTVLLDDAKQEKWDPKNYLVPAEWMTHFEAPELTWNAENGTYKTASDMWSLGAVAVAMMGGIDEDVDPTLPGTKLEPMSAEAQFTFKSLDRSSWEASHLPKTYSRPMRLFVAELLKLAPRARIDAETALNLAIWGELAFELREAEDSEEERRQWMPPIYTDEQLAAARRKFEEENPPFPDDDELFTPSPKQPRKQSSGFPSTKSRPPAPRMTTQEEEDAITVGQNHFSLPPVSDSDVESQPNTRSPAGKPPLYPGGTRLQNHGFRSSPLAPPLQPMFPDRLNLTTSPLQPDVVPQIFGGPKPAGHIPEMPKSFTDSLRPDPKPMRPSYFTSASKASGTGIFGGVKKSGRGPVGRPLKRSPLGESSRSVAEQGGERFAAPGSRVQLTQAARNARLSGSDQDSPLGFGRYVRQARERKKGEESKLL